MDAEVVTAVRDELDLTNQKEVADFFSNNQIDQVYLAAAKVGGILLTTPILQIYISKFNDPK